jgi:hypothetical protein
MELRDGCVVVYLRRRGKPDLECYIDIIDVPKMAGLCFVCDDQSTRPGAKFRHLNLRYAVSAAGYLHRIIKGNPKGWVIDHADHDGLNNRRSNLRKLSHAENGMNRAGAARHSKSGIRGVYFCIGRGKWAAHVTINRKARHLGYFDTKEEAEVCVLYAHASRTVPVRNGRRRVAFALAWQASAREWDQQGRPEMAPFGTPWQLLAEWPNQPKRPVHYVQASFAWAS